MSTQETTQETGWTNEQAIKYYQRKMKTITETKDEMQRINAHLESLKKSVKGNQFTAHSLNAVIAYQQKLIGLVIDYYDLLQAALDQVLEDEKKERECHTQTM